MREAIVCFVIALIIGAAYNSLRQLDWWGTEDNPTNVAATVPLVDEGDFEQKVLRVQGPVLVEFYSDDSTQSKVMVPIIANAARKLRGEVTVVRADKVDCPMISKMYSVATVPDFILFRGGEKISHVVGEMSDGELVDFVRHSLQPSGSPANTPEVQTETPTPTPKPSAPDDDKKFEPHRNSLPLVKPTTTG
jgi:thioredoxin 1